LTLDKSRVTETFQMFSKILNIEDSRMADIGIGFELPVGSILPTFMRILAMYTNRNPESAEGILNWIIDGILYMKSDLDQLPTVDFGYNISFDTEVAEEQRRKQILSKK